MYKRQDPACVLFAAYGRIVAVAFALGRVVDETFVFEDFEEGRDCGVFRAGFFCLGDDLVDHRIAQPPEYLHDLLFAACEFRLFILHGSGFRCV